MNTTQFFGGPSVISFNELVYVIRTAFINNHQPSEMSKICVYHDLSKVFIRVPSSFDSKVARKTLYEVMENEFSCDTFNYDVIDLDYSDLKVYVLHIPDHHSRYLRGETAW